MQHSYSNYKVHVIHNMITCANVVFFILNCNLFQIQIRKLGSPHVSY